MSEVKGTSGATMSEVKGTSGATMSSMRVQVLSAHLGVDVAQLGKDAGERLLIHGRGGPPLHAARGQSEVGPGSLRHLQLTGNQGAGHPNIATRSTALD